MKKNKFIIASLAALVLCSCGSNSPKALPTLITTDLDSLEMEYAPALEVGTEAPEIAAPDTSGTIVRLSDLRGNYVVLDFWATWCGDCRRELPDFAAIYDEYSEVTIGNAGIKFISYSFDEDEHAWKSYISNMMFSWPQLSDLKKMKDSPVAQAYKLGWIPTFYIITPDGKIAGGCITSARLREMLANLTK